MTVLANSAEDSPLGPTTLEGRIEVIGLFDLLQIAVTRGSTARLTLFDSHEQAWLEYEQGRLVQVTSGKSNGVGALNLVLRMHEGQFEYAEVPTQVREHPEPRLHELLVLALRTSHRQRLETQRLEPNVPSDLRASGVHRVANGKTGVSGEYRLGGAPLAPGEVGRARADELGRHQERIGPISTQETTCASLIVRLAAGVAAELGIGKLERVELRSGNTRALYCQVLTTGIAVAKVEGSSDLLAVWQGLMP